MSCSLSIAVNDHAIRPLVVARVFLWRVFMAMVADDWFSVAASCMWPIYAMPRFATSRARVKVTIYIAT